MDWTIEGVLKWTSDFFIEKGISNPRLDAELLLCKILKCERLKLFLDFNKPLTGEELTEYKKLISKRAKHFPLQYLTEKQEFMALPFNTKEGVFIPRCDTETIVLHVLDLLQNKTVLQPEILEIGTGTGAISISLAHYNPQAKITGIDINKIATELSQENALLNNVTDRTTFINISAEEFIQKNQINYDLIVSNPPYLIKGDPKIEYQVSNFEPPEALYAEERGLAFYKLILSKFSSFLNDHGFLVFEIGKDMESDILSLPKPQNIKFHEIKKDLAGISRSISFQRIDQ